MDLEDIRLFFAVYRSRSLSGAAYALFSTQSTVSRRLAALERELGLRLFRRGRGSDQAVLTEEGRRFLPLAEQFLRLEQQARALQNQGPGRRLTVAAPDSIMSYPLRDFIRELSAPDRRWDLDLQIHDSLPICEMVVGRTADLGLTNGEAPFSELASREVFREDFVVLRRGRPRAAAVHPLELVPAGEVFQPCGTAYDRWHDYWWKPGRAKASINLASLTVSCLTQEEDWAILPASVARSLRPADGYLQALTEPPPPRRCLLVWRRDRTPEQAALTEAFHALLRDFLSRQDGPAPSGEDVPSPESRETRGSRAEKST